MEPGSRPPGGEGDHSPFGAGISEVGIFADDTAGVTVDVVVEALGWRRLLPQAGPLARRAALAALAEYDAAGGVTVLLTDDRALRRLNHDHRGKAKPTNVLSFPGGTPGHLGDIALALGVVRREALAAGKHPAAHFAHLVAHGTLHLLGHDHLEVGEARRMEQAEARAMRRLRLPNPWRAAGRDGWRAAA
jgi:probable rRNA maturation factor